MRLLEALAIGFGGACGALARAELSRWLALRFGLTAPWPTFSINLLGCFLTGALSVWLARRGADWPLARPLLAVGLLGGFTTYSAFAQETLALLREGSGHQAALSIAAHLGLCLGAAAAGGALAGGVFSAR
jgi:CrcB protein